MTTTSSVSIKNLFDPEYENHKTYEISTEFQITKIHKQDTKNLTQGELYTLTLSDPEYSYSKFIYCKTNSSPELEIGKYINITKICPMILEAHKEKAFLIKELSILKKDSLIHIKSPPYIDNNKGNNNHNMNNNINNNNTNNNSDKEDDDYNENIMYTPLKQLNTLSQDYKLLIKVTSKGGIKQFRSGKGQLFSFTIMDEFGSKMQAVGFDKIADKYKDEIIENNIYEITGGYIRTADKRFDPPGSDYKLILNESSIITKKNILENNLKDRFCDPDNKYLTLREVKEASINSIVNVMCIIGDKGETSYKDTKGGSLLIRKTIVLDQSNEKMELTLWRNFTQLNINNGDLLVCQKVRVNDFGGKNLTSTTDSKIFINPSINDFPGISKELQALRNFSEQNELNKGIIDTNDNTNYSKSNNNNSYNKVKNENNNYNSNYYNNKNNIINNNINISNNNNGNNVNNKNYNDKIIYMDSILEEMDKYVMTDFEHRFPFYKIRATVTHLGHTEKNFYPGCPNRECNRKVSYSNGDWICQYCRQSFKTPKYYYSLNIRVKDCSSEYWVDIFGKPAELIMNMSADDYRNILINRDDEKLNQISNNVEYKEFYFLLKVRLNKFNDNTKKKFTANKIEKINKKEDTERLINDIKKKFYI